MKTEIFDTKSHTKQVEKKLKLGQETLSNKLMIVCNKLHETKCAFDEVKCFINNDVSSNIKRTETQISKLIEEEQKQQQMEIQVQQLKKENCIKDETLHHMNKKIKELQKDNEYNIAKINKQIKQLYEWKFKIENTQTSENNCRKFT